MSERIIFIDTETTGLSPSYARIIEIAAVEVDHNFQPKRIFHEYLDPKQSVGTSSRIHGLTDSFLRGRKTFRDIAPDFISFVRGGTVYAHNLPFDRGFIDAELTRCGHRPLSSFAEAHDTLVWARNKVSGKASLDALIDRFRLDGSARSAHHGALIDAELLAKVFLCLAGNREKALTLCFDTLNRLDENYQRTCMPSYPAQKPASALNPISSSSDGDDDDCHEDEEPPSRIVRVQRHPDEYEAKLEAIIEFADNNDRFDGSMYEDILDRYLETGWHSDRQRDVIDSIICRFSIDY